jgi:hypothetical protein
MVKKCRKHYVGSITDLFRWTLRVAWTRPVKNKNSSGWARYLVRDGRTGRRVLDPSRSHGIIQLSSSEGSGEPTAPSNVRSRSAGSRRMHRAQFGSDATVGYSVGVHEGRRRRSPKPVETIICRGVDAGLGLGRSASRCGQLVSIASCRGHPR